MKTFKQFIIEAGDYWDPDPEKDKKLPGKGPQMRSREDRGKTHQCKQNLTIVKD
jgi:hypothetical protein